MTEMILRSNQGRKNTGVKQSRRFSAKNIVSTVITVLLLGASFTAGLGISGTPATSTSQQANAYGFCAPGFDLTGPNAGVQIAGAWPGGLANMAATSAELAEAFVDKPVTDSNLLTAYEWYGTAGMTFYAGTWFPDSGCSSSADLNNIIPNLIQSNNIILGEVLLTVIAWGLNANYIQELITGEDAVVTKIIEGFQDSLYLRWFLPLITLAAAAIAYAGLVRKRGSEAIQGTIWVVVSAALALVFFMNPTQIASWVDKAVISVGNEITSATARIPGVGINPDNSTDLCSLNNVNLGNEEYSAGINEKALELSKNREMRISECVLWKTFIYQPWAASQFGPLANDVTLRVPEEAKASFRGNTTLPIVFLDTRVLNRAEVVSGERQNERREKQWESFKEIMINNEEAKAGWENFSGKDGNTRFGPVIVGAVALIFGLFPLTMLSFTLVTQQIIMLLLLLLAPIALTVGLFPGRGRKIMLGWVEMFLGTLIKRLIAYVLIAVLIAAMTAVMNDTSGSSYLLQVGLVAAIGFGILKIRKTIQERFGTVNLGGDQGSFMKENLSAVKQGYQQTRGTITQPIADFSKARAKGKTFTQSVGSGLAGAVKGAKTGGPTAWETAKTVGKNSAKGKSIRNAAAAAVIEKQQQSEEAAFSKRADITDKRQARKIADQTRKTNAKLNSTLSDLNRNLFPDTQEEGPQGNGGDRRVNTAEEQQNEASPEEAANSGIDNSYSEKLAKLKLKEESIRSDIEGIQNSIDYIDLAVQRGSLTSEEAKYQKDGLTSQLMGLREDEQFIIIKKRQLEIKSSRGE